jgi:hypothetical protein
MEAGRPAAWSRFFTDSVRYPRFVIIFFDDMRELNGDGVYWQLR